MIENVITTWFITRKCNLKCSPCQIVKRMGIYNIDAFKKELNFEGKIKVCDTLKELDCKFLVLMGGEPLVLGDELIKIIKHMNKIDLPYGICSNSILALKYEDKLKRAKVRNWSISFDCLPNKSKNDIIKKTNISLKVMKRFKKFVPDLHGTITVNHKNVGELIPMVELLNNNGIWSEITALHWAKNAFYDFASRKDRMKSLLLTSKDMERLKPIMEQLKQMKKDGYLIHNDYDYFDFFMKHAYNLDWRCKSPFKSMCLDSDGVVRLCLHCRGTSTTKVWYLLDEEKLKEFKKNWKDDMNKICNNCAWDCRYMAERHNLENGAKIFQHKVSK